MHFHLNVVRCFANRHTILFKFHHMVIDRLPFIRKTIDCILKQHQDRAQSTQLSVTYTVSIHHVCRGIGAMSITGVVFIEHEKSVVTINELFYHSITTDVNCYQTCCD